jgi:hypothetical protein
MKWFLTIDSPGLPLKYHLRSVSGSSGPIAKETSPLLGWRPIFICAGQTLLTFKINSNFKSNTNGVGQKCPSPTRLSDLDARVKNDALVTNL